MIRPKRLGHVVFLVSDGARSKDFYTRILGLHVLEEDSADHGGTIFLGLREFGNTLDLIPSTDPKAGGAHLEFRSFGGLGMHHAGFEVESHEALREAYFTLVDNKVPIIEALDHDTTQSIYFKDPDGHVIELYWPRPSSARKWEEGREDEHLPLKFTR